MNSPRSAWAIPSRTAARKRASYSSRRKAASFTSRSASVPSLVAICASCASCSGVKCTSIAFRVRKNLAGGKSQGSLPKLPLLGWDFANRAEQLVGWERDSAALADCGADSLCPQAFRCPARTLTAPARQPHHREVRRAQPQAAAARLPQPRRAPVVRTPHAAPAERVAGLAQPLSAQRPHAAPRGRLRTNVKHSTSDETNGLTGGGSFAIVGLTDVRKSRSSYASGLQPVLQSRS